MGTLLSFNKIRETLKCVSSDPQSARWNRKNKDLNRTQRLMGASIAIFIVGSISCTTCNERQWSSLVLRSIDPEI